MLPEFQNAKRDIGLIVDLVKHVILLVLTPVLQRRTVLEQESIMAVHYVTTCYALHVTTSSLEILPDVKLMSQMHCFHHYLHEILPRQVFLEVLLPTKQQLLAINLFHLHH